MHKLIQRERERERERERDTHTLSLSLSRRLGLSPLPQLRVKTCGAPIIGKTNDDGSQKLCHIQAQV